MESYFDTTLKLYRNNPDFRIYRKFPNSVLVFRYRCEDGSPRVKKQITEMPGDDREFQISTQWYGFLGLDVTVSSIGRITEVDMPWFGTDLSTLSDELELNLRLGDFSIGFTGVGEEQATSLLANTFSLLRDFYTSNQLVYDDLNPKNVLYHPDYNFFPVIDAESFCHGSERRWRNFCKNFDFLSEYVYQNLVIY